MLHAVRAGVMRLPDQYCPNCGTEVEADARFCPSCGTTLMLDEAEAAKPEEQAQLPAAPGWPEPEPEPEVEPAAEAEATSTEPTQAMDRVSPPGPYAAADAASAMPAAPSTSEQASGAPAEPPPSVAHPTTGPPRPSDRGRRLSGGLSELPFTWPTMLSGWLIGAGSLLGAIFLIPRLGGAGSLVSWLLLLALLGIAATVFIADRVPAVPRLRLAILVTTSIGLGVALARSAFSIQGADTLFLVAMLAAAGGALLIELDADRPFPPPDRPNG